MVVTTKNRRLKISLDVRRICLAFERRPLTFSRPDIGDLTPVLVRLAGMPEENLRGSIAFSLPIPAFELFNGRGEERDVTNHSQWVRYHA